MTKLSMFPFSLFGRTGLVPTVFVIIVLLLTTLLFPRVALAYPTFNLIENGGMETGDPLSNWTLSGAGATFAQSTTQVWIGTYSGALTRSGTDCVVYQLFLLLGSPGDRWSVRLGQRIQ